MTTYDIKAVCADAVSANGWKAQAVVALEELSEAQKEICKLLRGQGDKDHLAEEIADVAITLEQMEMAFGISDSVRRWMDKKAQRLADRLKGGSCE